MVTIINYKKHITKDGRDFLVLIVQGGIEMVQSKKTGNYYATIRQANVPSTFDELTCKSLVGTELSGMVEKVETDPYEYTIKETGEVIELSHRWQYNPNEPKPKVEKSTSTIDDFIIPQRQEKFSMNGVEH
ncbi:hypothetical protein [Dokdonia sp. Asnod2-E02]|uniref:hypothetical protein n=1 Tax=Dokdonia sp. Asnod2-E02 TaxID=3160574 RepID=UPI0038657A8A